MTEIRSALTLGRAHSEVILRQENSVAVLSDIARDLDRVFGERHIWFPQWRTHLQLASKEDSELRPPYAFEARYCHGSSEWQVTLGDLKDPGQAAARTALLVYQQKRGSKINGNDQLRINDAQATVLDLGRHGAFYANLKRSDKRRELKSFYDHGAGAELTWGIGLQYRALPEMLGELQARREQLYGDAADPLAVTAMLGAHVELREFTDTWNDAAAQRTPLRSARYLLDSGIFTPPQSLESQF